MSTYLDFEKPIEELVNQIEEAKKIGEKTNVDISKTIKELEKKLEQTKAEIY
ncbi:MAG TPA: acetyl-CoA carboxylase carboxyl transferase subunit alpha, partial [Flavobacteriales bacterium]|nr:acetyl-CoA carboxylase carboxyl transferase subunit alpha [Flavobacteriales bacterium]